MTSEDNLSWLLETGRHYLVGTPKSELRKWARQIADAQDWQAVREGVVEAKHCVGPDGAETFVLVHSIERREKERTMHDCFSRRVEDGLSRLGRRLRQARRLLERGRPVATSSRSCRTPVSTPACGWSPSLRRAHSSRSGRAANIAGWSPGDLWRT